MANQNEALNSLTGPFWWWPRWMTDPLGSSGAALAPQSLNQPILPGWTFGNVITVTETNSSSPEMERDILSKESYGRQLGRIIDALEVLIQERPKNAPTNAALDDFLRLSQKINEIKSQSSVHRVKRLQADLARLKKDSPEEYRQIVSELLTDAQGNR